MILAIIILVDVVDCQGSVENVAVKMKSIKSSESVRIFLLSHVSIVCESIRYLDESFTMTTPSARSQ